MTKEQYKSEVDNIKELLKDIDFDDYTAQEIIDILKVKTTYKAIAVSIAIDDEHSLYPAYDFEYSVSSSSDIALYVCYDDDTLYVSIRNNLYAGVQTIYPDGAVYSWIAGFTDVNNNHIYSDYCCVCEKNAKDCDCKVEEFNKPYQDSYDYNGDDGYDDDNNDTQPYEI
jgi:hypothetical protein